MPAQALLQQIDGLPLGGGAAPQEAGQEPEHGLGPRRGLRVRRPDRQGDAGALGGLDGLPGVEEGGAASGPSAGAVVELPGPGTQAHVPVAVTGGHANGLVGGLRPLGDALELVTHGALEGGPDGHGLQGPQEPGHPVLAGARSLLVNGQDKHVDSMRHPPRNPQGQELDRRDSRSKL